MNPSATPPSNTAPADKDLAEQARPGHGIPSQDPSPAAQGDARGFGGVPAALQRDRRVGPAARDVLRDCECRWKQHRRMVAQR